MDECAARLQPLVDHYKNPYNIKLSQKKNFRDMIVTTRSCPGDKKNLFKKNIFFSIASHNSYVFNGAGFISEI